jgi:hypothetical protein
MLQAPEFTGGLPFVEVLEDKELDAHSAHGVR